MNFEVIWSNHALDDFDGILAWIAADNRHAADNIADRIEETAGKLSFMNVGRKGRVAGTYEKPLAGLPYVIVYALANETITILRIIHAARDWPEQAWPI